MKQICIIGNSHIACLKTGLDLISTNINSNFSFFGAAGEGLFNLKADSGIIYPEDAWLKKLFVFLADGKKQIILSDYDLFIIVGSGISMLKYIEFYKRFGSEKQRSKYFAPYFVSSACYELARNNFFFDATGQYVYNLIRTFTNRPILVIPAPFPAHRIKSKYKFWEKLLVEENLDQIASTYYEVIKNNFTRNTIILPIPETLLETSITTKSTYSLEARINLRLHTKDKDNRTEILHMNDNYGKDVMTMIINYIDSNYI